MSTFAEERAFMEPVLAAYRDDGPRLILADYLDESPDPADHARAEFIRIQIALARLSQEHPARKNLLSRQGDFLMKYLNVWTSHLKGLASGFQYRRGILDTVSVDVVTLINKGEQLFERVPIRRLKVLDAGRHVGQLAKCGLLERVRELDVCGTELGPEGVQLLLRSGHLSNVEVLDLSHNGLGNAGLAALARYARLPKLRELSMSGNGINGSDGIQSFVESPLLQELRSLDLSGNDIEGIGLQLLAGSTRFPKLNILQIQHNLRIHTGIPAFAESPLLTRILTRNPRLDLRRTGITVVELEAILTCKAMANVQSLDLSFNFLGDEGTIAISQSAKLTGLKSLAISTNQVADSGAYALAYSQVMNQLRYLDVSSNHLSPSALHTLWIKSRPGTGKDIETTIELSNNRVPGNNFWSDESYD